jgi:hypothetical protein
MPISYHCILEPNNINIFFKMVAPTPFDPTSVEWLALIVYIFVGSAASYAFVHSAIAFHWEHLYKRRDIYHPPMFWPEVYGLLRLSAGPLLGVGSWFVFREGFRSEMTTPMPVSGVVPDATDFFVFNLIFVILLGLNGLFGLSLFQAGLKLKWLSIPFFNDLLVLGCLVVLVVYGFFISTTAGIILVFPAAFNLYSVIMMLLLWINTPLVEDLIMAPFDWAVQTIDHLRQKGYQVVTDNVSRPEEVVVPMDAQISASAPMEGNRRMPPTGMEVHPGSNGVTSFKFHSS